MQRKKALYIGHIYHRKTRSTDFLKELLKESYDVDYCSFDPYTCEFQGNIPVSEKEYDYLICFQVMPVRVFLDQKYSYKKGILFPMYDAAVELADEGWNEFKDFLIISFSQKLCQKLSSLGIESKYIQYFPKPFSRYEKGEKDSVFFWQRRENISIDTLNQVLRGNNIKHIKLHIAMDPEQVYTPCDNALKAEIIETRWFEEKELLLREIESCSLYMASRRYEGIGMSFLEAMAMGRCVIAPNEGTMDEYIRDGVNGYLYDWKNIQSVSLGNISKLQDKAYQTIVEGYQKWCEEKKNIVKWIDECIPTPLVEILTYVEKKTEKDALERCIKSVHDQDYSCIRHTIISECNDNDINNLLGNYAKMGWIKVVKGKGRGKYGEYGKLVSEADGFYVMFLDCTSWYSRKDSVSQYVSKIQSGNFNYCYSNCKLVNERNYVIGTLIPIPEALFAYSAYNYQAAIYQVHILKHESIFGETYMQGADFELESKLFIRGYRGVYLCLECITIVNTILNEKETDRIEDLINICSDIYGLEKETYYSELRKLICERKLSKHMYKHICNCIKGDMADRIIIALREVDNEYEVSAHQIVHSKIEEIEPLVTIVTVTYNVIDAGREKTFRQCVESIRSQTYHNIEHLIIDGASKDGTLSIIKEYERKGWLRYISEPDNGVWDAMRKGMIEANGKYINYLNTDDFFSYRNSVALAVEELERQNADYFFSPANRIEKDGNSESVQALLNYYGNEDTVWWGKGMCHQSMYVKTDLLRELDPFNADIEISLDNYMMLQLVAGDKKAAYLDMPLVTFRMGGISAVEDVQDTFAKYFFECCGKKFGMSYDECRSIWMLKCLKDKGIIFNLRLLQKLDKKRWREYFADLLSEKILESNTSEEHSKKAASDALSANIQRLEKRNTKFTEYFHLLNLWMKKNNNRIKMADYLKKQGISRIAVYGVGELGDRLYEELEESGIEIAYAIDSNINRVYHQKEVKSPTQGLGDIQMIIVTPIAEYESIKEKLNQVTTCQIVSLKEIVQEM